MAHATTTDVAILLLRELEPNELELAERLLLLAAANLRTRIADLELRMVEDPDFDLTVSHVEASAVKRVLENADGIAYEVIGPFSSQRPVQPDAGGLVFTKSELASLGIGSGAFTIRPYMDTGSEHCFPDELGGWLYAG